MNLKFLLSVAFLMSLVSCERQSLSSCDQELANFRDAESILSSNLVYGNWQLDKYTYLNTCINLKMPEGIDKPSLHISDTNSISGKGIANQFSSHCVFSGNTIHFHSWLQTEIKSIEYDTEEKEYFRLFQDSAEYKLKDGKLLLYLEKSSVLASFNRKN